MNTQTQWNDVTATDEYLNFLPNFAVVSKLQHTQDLTFEVLVVDVITSQGLLLLLYLLQSH